MVIRSWMVRSPIAGAEPSSRSLSTSSRRRATTSAHCAGRSACGSTCSAAVGDESGLDIDLVPSGRDVIAAQPPLAVTSELAGLQVVLPAMPWADDVDFLLGEPLTQALLVLGHHRLDLAHHHALGHRTAHVQAVVLQGVEAAVVAQDDNLAAVHFDGAPPLVIEIRDASCQPFSHECLQIGGGDDVIRRPGGGGVSRLGCADARTRSRPAVQAWVRSTVPPSTKRLDRRGIIRGYSLRTSPPIAPVTSS